MHLHSVSQCTTRPSSLLDKKKNKQISWFCVTSIIAFATTLLFCFVPARVKCIFLMSSVYLLLSIFILYIQCFSSDLFPTLRAATEFRIPHALVQPVQMANQMSRLRIHDVHQSHNTAVCEALDWDKLSNNF